MQHSHGGSHVMASMLMIIAMGGWSSLREPHSIQRKVVIAIGLTGSGYLQTILKSAGNSPTASVSAHPAAVTNGTLMRSVITIAGKKHWLWRAVDQQGFVLDVLVQSRRDKKAAKRLFRKLLKKQGRAPRVLITDKLRSYGAAKRRSCPPSSTASIKVSTIGRRILTNRRDDESEL